MFLRILLIAFHCLFVCKNGEKRGFCLLFTCGNDFTQINGAKSWRISEIKTRKNSKNPKAQISYCTPPPRQAPHPLLSPTPLFLLSAGHLVVSCHMRLPSCQVAASLEFVCLSTLPDLPNNLPLCRRRRLISSFLVGPSCRFSQLQARGGQKRKTHARTVMCLRQKCSSALPLSHE